MIQPRAVPGIAFGEVSDGDVRDDPTVRSALSNMLEIPDAWAFVGQVHGSTIAQATEAGDVGTADGIITQVEMLPIAIATADCVPIVIVGSRSRAIVHAGWRGVASRIVQNAVRVMGEVGDRARGVVIGPHIGPCCYEVGPDVVAALGGHSSRTVDDALSVDLAGAIREQLGGIEVEDVEMCTMHDPRFHSFRRNETQQRQMTVTWIPQG